MRRISESWTTPEHSGLVEDVINCIRPDDEELNAWYRKYAQRQKKRLAFDVDYVTRFADPSAKLLEFGSMPPILTATLTRLGMSVTGLDLKPERFETAVDSEGLRVERVDFETERLPLEDGAYDAVIFNEVFEHLRINPIFTLREVHRVLRPGGILMLSTPNLRSWKGWYFFAIKGRLAPEIYGEYDKLGKVGHMGHVRVYSVGEVKTFLERIGFHVETVIHRGEFQSTVPWRKRLGDASLRVLPRLRTSFSLIANRIP